MFASTIRVRCNAMRVSSMATVVRTNRILTNNACTTYYHHHSNNNNNMIVAQFRQMHLLLLNKTSPQQLQSLKRSSLYHHHHHRRMESTTTTTTTTAATKESATMASTANTTTSTASVATPPPPPTATVATTTKKQGGGWWHSAELWGTAGALACWGMAGSAIYDAFNQGPEVISVSLTPVLIVYSAMFTRWAWIVNPRNTFLAACHVTNIAAQSNQLRRALEYKYENGQEKEVNDMIQQAGIGGVFIAGAIAIGPTIRAMLSNAQTFGTTIASIAAADAGPFTVHFWAPMSKWAISGASFFDLQRPTEKISLAQYTALTLTGFFFSRYALLVSPINYALCSVNIAMLASSGWHLCRKINADYLHFGLEPKKTE